jgi:hypothetical protein
VLAAHGWNVDCSVCRCGPACLVLTTTPSSLSFELGLRLGFECGCGGRGTAAGAGWWAGERAVGCLRVRARTAAVLVARLLLVSCGAGRSADADLLALCGGGCWLVGWLVVGVVSLGVPASVFLAS